MSVNRILNLTSLLAATAALGLGLTACGSDDDPGTGASGTEATKSTDVGTTGTTGESGVATEKNGADKNNSGGQGEGITPGKKAPESAGDKSENAPDNVISKRPGGPDK